MHHKARFPNVVFGATLRPQGGALAILLMLLFLLFVLLFMTLTAQQAQAQAFKVIYTFTGGADGAYPYAGLTMDRAGNLYGTTQGGGKGFGTVFKLTNKNSNWVLNPLYSFQGDNDGANPTARVIFGPDGSLYGTTPSGGAGYGTVFKLQPSPVACKTTLCPWTETVLYRFTGGSDGANPQGGDLLISQSGVIYGTTLGGGAYGRGAIFSLTPSHGAWTENILYSFTGGNDGEGPYSSVISDNAGDLYGTASAGGSGGGGTVYELIPSGSGWQEKTLYSFPPGGYGYGEYPVGGLLFDGSGNLYGTTEQNSFQCCGGTVYELTPSNGNWTITNYTDLGGDMTTVGPVASLVMDAGGNLYGTSVKDTGVQVAGEVFKWTPGWGLEPLYDFWRPPYGGYAYGQLILDASGDLYGTTEFNDGYEDGYGVTFELTRN